MVIYEPQLLIILTIIYVYNEHMQLNVRDKIYEMFINNPFNIKLFYY